MAAEGPFIDMADEAFWSQSDTVRNLLYNVDLIDINIYF